MFSKKNKETARKVKVENLTPDEQAIKINIQVKPLVRIERHQLTVNGKPQAPEFRISIGGRDVLMVNSREYHELFMEILRHKEAGELIHDISAVHAEEHAHADKEMHDVAELFNGLETAIKLAFKED